MCILGGSLGDVAEALEDRDYVEACRAVDAAEERAALEGGCSGLRRVERRCGADVSHGPRAVVIRFYARLECSRIFSDARTRPAACSVSRARDSPA